MFPSASSSSKNRKTRAKTKSDDERNHYFERITKHGFCIAVLLLFCLRDEGQLYNVYILDCSMFYSGVTRENIDRLTNTL